MASSTMSEDSVEKLRENMDFDGKDNEVYRKVIFEPIRIGPVSTLDEMDCKVLQFQNKKLEMKLEEYQRIENELQLRIEQLEKRQSQDKIVMNVMNRYWDHLNEDVKTMLLQFDDECQNTVDRIENEAALSFIKTLAACTESQIDEKLMSTVQVSTAALTKIIQAYDYVLAKSERTLAVLKSIPEDAGSGSHLDTTDPFDELLLLDHDDMFLEKRYLPYSGTDRNHTKYPFRPEIACIDDLESISESETTDSVGKSKQPLDIVTQAGATYAEMSKVTSKRASSRSDPRAEERPDSQIDADDVVKDVVTEIVERISSKFDGGCDSPVVEDVHAKGNISDVSERMENEDDVFGTQEVDGKLENEFDGQRFHEKLSAVRSMGDRIKEKSQMSVSTLKELKNVCADIVSDNARLQDIMRTFQEEYQQSTANEQSIMDAITAKEQEYEEWKARVDDIEYENEKLKYRKFKIEHHLAEAAETLEKIKVRERNRAKSDTSVTTGKKFEEFEEELELHREVALNRSQELESLRAKYQSNLDAIEELEKSLNDLPDHIVEDTTEYKCLQSQFSVLYNDTIQIKDQIEEYHAHIQTLNATFANKMEMTETEDLMTLRKLQTDLLQMQQANSQLRREYQMLKIEFERNLVANEQTGPLNKEMRYLLVRLQKHNKHLKHEAQRYKRKYKELNAELNLLSKQSYSDSKFKMESEGGSSSDFDENEYGLDMGDDFLDLSMKEDALDVKKEKLDPGCDDSTDPALSLYDRPLMAIAIKQEPPDISPPESPSSMPSQSRRAVAGPSRMCPKLARKRRRDTLQECRDVLNRSSKELREFQEIEEVDDEKLSEDEYVQDLRNQLKIAETEQKELKLLLDMYKSVNRDKREKMQLLCAEKKLKADIEDTKTQMRRILEIKRENRKKLADEDALRKIKYLEEQNFLLLRQINVHKQEEEALLSEMEVTNQAFEDMQEQNSRLIQQLREKDDANSKLMAERIKSNLLYKITREEKESLQALISATAKQLDSVTTVMNELEEKEQVYQTAINNVEKEINLRQQALELHRKKALEYAQTASELKLNLEKYLADTKEAKQQISEKSSALEAETFKHNRLQEEVAQLRHRVERMKKLEPSETPDIVLVEEVREYKEMLTCQSCKVRRKDAVLSKCFHVFCWECLRTRYETRQRKCPKCNATFGANDYHRLFFTN